MAVSGTLADRAQDPRNQRSPLFTLLAATLCMTLGALPVFLLGAMAVLIRPELGFGESALGALASLYYLASALSTVPSGRLAERLGSRRAMGLAAVVSMVSSIGIAAVADGWGSLAVFMIVAGIANGIAFPASNLAVAKGIPARRQGIAFGVKQSSGPYATMLAGAAVPLIGLTVGWRWAFALAAAAAVPIVVGARRSGLDGGSLPGSRGPVPLRSLWLMALAAFCGVGATASLGAFYVESAVAAGMGPALAGTFLSLGSLVGVLFRVGWGRLADRAPASHFVLIPALLLVGGPAFALLGQVSSSGLLLAVTVLVFASGWAWPSILNFAVVLRTPAGPGRASGILGAGQFGGGTVGPFLFGVLAERAGYGPAWAAAGLMLGAAAALVWAGGRSLDRHVTLTAGARGA